MKEIQLQLKNLIPYCRYIAKPDNSLEECLEFFVTKHYNVFKSAANLLKYAPTAKVVVVGRRQSYVIHFHSEIIFVWL